MPTTDEIRAIQRAQTDYFHFWRLGLGYRYDRRARREAVAKIEFPRRGKWPGFERAKIQHNPGRINEVWDEAGPAATRARAVEANRRLVERMDAAGFRFVKILGWGGLGVASLFEGTDARGKRFRVVCKMDLYEKHGCVADEIEMHLRTAGAKHVIQRVVLQGKRKQARTSRRRESEASSRRSTRRGQDLLQDIRDDDDDFEVLDRDQVVEDMKVDTKEELDADQRVLFIEFMSRGRFDDYIGRVALARARFPDQVLWQVFDCLFRAVIGMAYPDAFQPVGSDPRTQTVPQVSETCVGFPELTSHCRRETIVHFDIDPLNVLVGDFDQDEHNLVPILKIADLGLATVFNGGYRQLTHEVWSVRSCGKIHIFTPEQFSEEWDYVNSTPQAAHCQTAGNFNWWTNLYQVALIMWSMITLCEVEYPPVVEELDLTHPDGTVTKEWTYGGYLLHPKFFATDAELRNLIALCLNYNPTRRPTMQELEVTIRKHVRAGGPIGDGEREAHRWSLAVFGGPPPPPPEPSTSGEQTGGPPGLPKGLKGPGEDLAVLAARKRRLAPEDEEEIREMNRIAGIRRAPKAQILLNRLATGLMRSMLG